MDTNESKTLFITDQLGGTDFAINPSIGILSMVITNATNDTLKKDWTIESNWDSFIEETKKNPSQYDPTYTLILEDSDF